MKGTQSIERAIQILRLFNDEKPDWMLPELIEATGLKKTTVFRMLTTLKHEGFLEQTDSGTWCLGSELIALGGRSMRRHRFRAIANDEMRHVARQTGESVTIDVLWIGENDAPFSMVIDECLGHHLLGMTQYIGARLPAHATSTGKVLLAFQSQDLIGTFNLKSLPALTPHTVVTPQALIQGLSKIREAGVGYTLNELEIGIVGVAVPIFDHHGKAIAALSVAGPASRISDEKLETFSPILSKAAASISHKIGYRGPNPL